MGLLRLRRKKFHTCMCGAVLILVNSGAIYFVSRSVPWTLLTAVLYGVVGGLTEIFELEYGKPADLLKEHLIPCMAVFVVWGIAARDIFMTIILFLMLNAVYAIWMILTKKWMRHEICPAWTVLVYDSRENRERAETIVKNRQDIMEDVYHCAFAGAEKWDARKEKCRAVSSLAEVEQIVRTFRIPQMVICLDTGKAEMLEYCKNAGITAFVKEKPDSRIDAIRRRKPEC